MFFDDVRSAVRSVSRAKALTAVLLVSLGIGTGANAAVFSVVNSLLFQAPPGIEDADELATIHTSHFDGSPYGPSSLPDFEFIPQSVSAFADVAALDETARVNVAIGDHTHFTRVSAVSPQFFTTLGLEAQVGRLPSAAELRDHAQVAVISHELWTVAERHSLDALTVIVRQQTYRVVGVGPEGFRGLQAGRFSDVWIPLVDLAPGRGERRLAVVGRLRKDASVEEANAQLSRFSQALAELGVRYNL